MRKGLSLLVATILLVAFTSIIASFLFSWSKIFSTSTLETAQQCSPAYSIESLSILNTNISITLYNPNSYTAFTGLRATLLYRDSSKNIQNINLSAYGAKDPMETADITSVVIDTPYDEKPERVLISSKNCPNAIVERKFL